MGPTQTAFCFIFMVFPMILVTCSHSEKKSVCTRRSLTTIPTDCERDITSLDVSHNNIQKLDEAILQLYPKLEHLNISYNKFQSENNLEAISALKQLKSVDLSGNPLNTFDFGIFSGNTKLETIIFENVTSVFIKQKSVHLRNLKTVSFKYSDLQYFPIEAFSKARKLENFDLSYTKITFLPESICKVFPKLQRIIVKDVNIKHLVPCLQAVSKVHLHNSEAAKTKIDEGNDATNFKQIVHKMNQTGIINFDSQNNDGEGKAVSYGSFKNVSHPHNISKFFKSKASVVRNVPQSKLMNICNDKNVMYDTSALVGLLILIIGILGLTVTIIFWLCNKNKKNNIKRSIKYEQNKYLLEKV